MAYKNGKTEIATVLVWVLIVGVIAYVANFGGFKDTINGFGGGGSTPQPITQPVTTPGSAPLTDTANCPTDGTTTLTVNVEDALTSASTSRYPEYYIFNGNQLIKEGNFSSSATTVSLSCGKDYDVFLVDTALISGMYGKVVKFQARLAQETLNVEMVRFGGAKILAIENPAGDYNSLYNATLTASGSKTIQIKFTANETEKGYNKPIILCEVSTSNITTFDVIKFDDGTPVKSVPCPSRISASSGFRTICAEYGEMLDQVDGVITADVKVQAGSVAPGPGGLTCRLLDQADYKLSGYKSAKSISEAFKFGAENTDTVTNVGAYDSATSTFGWLNEDGY